MFISRNGKHASTCSKVLSDFILNKYLGIETIAGCYRDREIIKDDSTCIISLNSDDMCINMVFDNAYLGFTKNAVFSGLPTYPQHVIVENKIKSPYSNRRYRCKIIDMDLFMDDKSIKMTHHEIMPDATPILDSLIMNFNRLNYQVSESYEM